jgi:hypothetical protein
VRITPFQEQYAGDHLVGVVLEAIVRLRTKPIDEAVEGNRADAGFRSSNVTELS